MFLAARFFLYARIFNFLPISLYSLLIPNLFLEVFYLLYLIFSSASIKLARNISRGGRLPIIAELLSALATKAIFYCLLEFSSTFSVVSWLVAFSYNYVCNRYRIRLNFLKISLSFSLKQFCQIDTHHAYSILKRSNKYNSAHTVSNLDKYIKLSRIFTNCCKINYLQGYLLIYYALQNIYPTISNE